MPEPEKRWENDVDGLADFHARLSNCESMDVKLSRRITALEEAARGRYADDPMAGMGSVVLVMVVLTLAPIVLDLVKQWRLSQSSQ
jgi:tRNA G10  N-methylase Trm11